MSVPPRYTLIVDVVPFMIGVGPSRHSPTNGPERRMTARDQESRMRGHRGQVTGRRTGFSRVRMNSIAEDILY